MADPVSQHIDKVTALITCRHNGEEYLLLFKHPYEGIQFPAGTVESGEAPAIAARREAVEETGIADLGQGRHLETQEETLPADIRLMTVTAPVYVRPDLTSATWATLRNGLPVRIEREVGDFTQVTYEEFDQEGERRMTAYALTGWVSSCVLARRYLRHFYHFQIAAEPTEQWDVRTDNHQFRLFWAPLANLPAINLHQAAWVSVLR